MGDRAVMEAFGGPRTRTRRPPRSSKGRSYVDPTAELSEFRDDDGSAPCLRIRPLFEDGDVMSVPQQSTSNGNAAHPGADDKDSQPPSPS